ncbi:MAG: transposase [Candidatus Eisenbacteria bacterium]
MTPTIARTWAPRGKTPILRHWQRHDRISVISGIAVSPERRRFGLYYQWYHHNIREVEVVAFLRDLLRHLRKPLIVIWDHLRVHRSKAVATLCRRVPRLHLEYLPAYAPELNPDEGVWRRTKKRLANACPEDRFDLALQVIEELEACRLSPSQLRSCIEHTGLTL